MLYTGERLIVDKQAVGVEEDVYKEHYERYKFAVNEVIKFQSENKFKELKVLDIACGAGYGSELMLKIPQAEIWGGDSSPEVIELAKNKYQTNKNLHFQVMQAEKLPFEDNFFEAVVSFETVEHITAADKFIAEIKRVLKPGGLLIMSTPNRVATKRLAIQNPYHIKEFSQAELSGILKQFNFDKIVFYGQRPLAKMGWKQKFLQKLYIIYRACICLHWLDRLVSQRAKQQTSQALKAVEENYQVELWRPDKEYLYMVAVGERGRE